MRIEESLSELLDHLKRLEELAELARRFHSSGLTATELKRLLDLLNEIIIHATGREDLHLVETIRWIVEWIDTYLPKGERFTLKGLKNKLPKGPMFPRIYEARRVFRELIGISLRSPLPPPPTLWDLINDFDALIEGFTDELIRHVRFLVSLFDEMQMLSTLIKFIKDNPGHLKGTLGECLCIWWMGRVLGDHEDKGIWKAAKGPVKARGCEIDVLSASKRREFAIAEVKISRNRDKLYEGCKQIANAADVFKDSDVLKKAGFTWIGETRRVFSLAEAALVTLYDLKEELKSELTQRLREVKGLNIRAVAVYDINDILSYLKTWSFKEKKRYLELFETVSQLIKTIS